DDRRLQCHHVRRRRHLVFFGFGTGARLRRLHGAWYSYLDRDGGDDDADDDRALVPLQAAGEVADLTNFTKPRGSSRNGGEGIECAPMKLLRLAPENTKFPFMRFRRVS